MSKGAEKKENKPKNKAKSNEISTTLVIGLVIAAALVLITQWQLSTLQTNGGGHAFTGGGSVNLDDVDITQIQNTAQSIAAVMDLEGITDAQSAIDIMVPTGTPEYGAQLGISFDDPVGSLGILAKYYYVINKEIQEDPAMWQRYLNLAGRPTGISCEFCCGVGPNGITPEGKSRCGCSHNPGILALTQYLMMSTDMSDAEVLREAMKWKTVWFPRDMVKLGMEIAGGDASALNAMPGMVGGC